MCHQRMFLTLLFTVLLIAVTMAIIITLSTSYLRSMPATDHHFQYHWPELQVNVNYTQHTDAVEDLQKKNLSNVYFSIKSSAIHGFDVTRLTPSALTWLRTVPSKNVFILADDHTMITETIARLGYNVKYVTCPHGHKRSGLVCKTGNEFRIYYEQVEAGKNFSWYCHLDDDMYVNTEQLGKILLSRDHNEEHYLGRNYHNQFTVPQYTLNHYPSGLIKNRKYRFATGAIYCMSKKLMSEMEIYVRGTKLAETSKALNNEDDVTVGFVIEAILGCELTRIPKMYQQYSIQVVKIRKEEDLKTLVTISYHHESGRYLHMPNPIFEFRDDPTRFFSYHCALYPTVQWCQSQTLPKLVVL